MKGLALTCGHDPTEGGVAMGIQEICRRSGTGVRVFREALPDREETRFCAAISGWTPSAFSARGCSFSPRRPRCRAGLRRAGERGIPAAVIGTITDPGRRVAGDSGARQPLAFSEQDEIVKLAGR